MEELMSVPRDASTSGGPTTTYEGSDRMSKRICTFPKCVKPREAWGLCKGHYQQYQKGQDLRPLRIYGNDKERFWSKVNLDAPNGCWEWTGPHTPVGYPVFKTHGKNIPAYRFSYQQAKGPIPPEMSIDHMCHNPPCVNPDHLRAVSHQANMQNRKGAHSHSKSGIRGVYWIAKHKKYRVEASVNGQKYFGGYFLDLETADKAARDLRRRVMPDSLLDR